MPRGLKHYQEARELHFLTFSCYHRQPFLAEPDAMHAFEIALERYRAAYGFHVLGYVVMPEHVHLPERGTTASVVQAIKQSVSRKLIGNREHFWQARYYDFNVWTAAKSKEKLSYLHRNPVKRGLVAQPEDWPWSSFRHYLTGQEGVVEVESIWTGRKRELMGTTPRVKLTQ
jgi:putative transposase